MSYSNGKLTFGYDDGNVAILEIKSGKLTKVAVDFDKRMPVMSTDVRHNYLVVHNRFEAIVVNWKTGKIVFSTQDTDLFGPRNILFANNDTIIISGNGTVLVYKITDNTYFDDFRGLEEEVVATVLKKDNTLVCADWTGKIHFFKMTNPEPIHQYDVDEQIYKVAVVEHNDALYTWHGTYACKWNVNTGELILIFKTDLEDDIEFMIGTLSYTREILISSGQSGSIYLWNTTTGQLIKTLAGHPHNIGSLAITENDILYSCGWDGIIRRWDLATFESTEVDITGLE